jgi:HSP20 family protein
MNMNSELNTASKVEKFIAPPVNIRETKDAIIVEAEMPGVEKSGLEVSVNADELVIVGRKAKVPEAGNPLWKEIPKDDFRRVFSLGDHVNRSDITASFDSGILSLRLGKAEDIKPKKIEVDFH